MCDCIKDLEEKLRESLSGGSVQFTNDTQWKPKNGHLESVLCHNIALMMPDFRKSLSIPFKARWTVGAKTKETMIPVTASHCPFCGVAFEEKKVEDAA